MILRPLFILIIICKPEFRVGLNIFIIGKPKFRVGLQKRGEIMPQITWGEILDAYEESRNC